MFPLLAEFLEMRFNSWLVIFSVSFNVYNGAEGPSLDVPNLEISLQEKELE